MTENEEDEYVTAMKAAGADVHAHRRFGSYQGDWWALLTYEGTTGWYTYSFGSCSVCDDYQKNFGWDEPTELELAEFGKKILGPDPLISMKSALKVASANIDWDSGADEMVNFIITEQAKFLNVPLEKFSYIVKEQKQKIVERQKRKEKQKLEDIKRSKENYELQNTYSKEEKKRVKNQLKDERQKSEKLRKKKYVPRITKKKIAKFESYAKKALKRMEKE